MSLSIHHIQTRILQNSYFDFSKYCQEKEQKQGTIIQVNYREKNDITIKWIIIKITVLFFCILFKTFWRPTQE